MSKLPALTPKEILRVLLRAGFYIHHQRGSHVQLRHQGKHHLRVTIPYHASFSLPSDTLSSILKQANIDREEFLSLI